jgi:rod shape-determining protein MreC
LKRPHYIALGLVVFLTLAILNLPSQMNARFKLGIGNLYLPLFGLAGFSHNLADTVADTFVPRRTLLRLNDELRLENQQLRLQVQQAQETASENARLRQLLGWQRQAPWKLKLAKVVLREPANWWRTVQIDLGSRDGVRTNLAVMTMDGLVGRVSSVGLTRSQVVLLGDPNCKVSARVENQTRDIGVIGPSGSVNTEFVTLGFLSRNANLKPGQNVVTSGEGGIFLKDIPIGKVVETEATDYGLRAEAQVKLGANLSALEDVWVMLP